MQYNTGNRRTGIPGAHRKNNYAGILEKLIAENRFNPFIEAVKKEGKRPGNSHMKP